MALDTDSREAKLQRAIEKLHRIHKWDEKDKDRMNSWYKAAVPFADLWASLEAKQTAKETKNAKPVDFFDRPVLEPRITESMFFRANGDGEATEKQQRTVEMNEQRPWRADARCIHPCFSLPVLSRSEFLSLDANRETRQILLEQLQRGECPAVPMANVAYLHRCFNQLLAAVDAFNRHERVFKPKTEAEGKMGQSSRLLGECQWAPDMLPWCFVFTAIHTLTRFLCHPQTCIRFDSVPLFLAAALYLVVRTDEGLSEATYSKEGRFQGSWPPLHMLCAPYDGLIVPEQVGKAARVLWMALDGVPPYTGFDSQADDVVGQLAQLAYPHDYCTVELLACERLWTRHPTNTKKFGMPRSTVELLISCDLETQARVVVNRTNE